MHTPMWKQELLLPASAWLDTLPHAIGGNPVKPHVTYPPPAPALPVPYLAGFLTHEGEEPKIDDTLSPGWRLLEINHQDVGIEQEEAEIREDVQVEDDDGGREEGSEARQAVHRLQPLLPEWGEVTRKGCMTQGSGNVAGFC